MIHWDKRYIDTFISLIYPKWVWDKKPHHLLFAFIVSCLMVSLGCNLSAKSDATPQDPNAPSNLATSQVLTTPLPVQDATAVLADVCFDGLVSLDGQRLVIGETGTLDNLYNGLNAICGEAVPRTAIDFTSQILVIAVDVVQACDGSYQALGLENNQLMLQFVQTGDCPFDIIAIYAATLARPADNSQPFQVVVIGT